MLTDNGVQFVQHDRRTERGLVDHIFGAVCSANDIEHRQTKPYHPWTNGQAERMVRTIKDATVKSFHYASITDLRRRVRDWLLAYNYAKQLKALRFNTPYEAVRQLSEKNLKSSRECQAMTCWTKHLGRSSLSLFQPKDESYSFFNRGSKVTCTDLEWGAIILDRKHAVDELTEAPVRPVLDQDCDPLPCDDVCDLGWGRF